MGPGVLSKGINGKVMKKQKVKILAFISKTVGTVKGGKKSLLRQ